MPGDSDTDVASFLFDLTLPLDKAADGYKAMDERRAVKCC